MLRNCSSSSESRFFHVKRVENNLNSIIVSVYSEENHNLSYSLDFSLQVQVTLIVELCLFETSIVLD